MLTIPSFFVFPSSCFSYSVISPSWYLSSAQSTIYNINHRTSEHGVSSISLLGTWHGACVYGYVCRLESLSYLKLFLIRYILRFVLCGCINMWRLVNEGPTWPMVPWYPTLPACPIPLLHRLHTFNNLQPWTDQPRIQKGYLQVDQPADPAHPHLRILEDSGFKSKVKR